MKKLSVLLLVIGLAALLTVPAAADEGSQKVLKEGLLGAVTGAVAADQSGGKAGKGALIGAGTNVIGGALLDSVFSGGQGQGTTTGTSPSQQGSYGQRVIKQGVLGGVTGAVAAEASGGKAGKGALIGAGTNVIGGAVLDSVFGSGQQAPAHTGHHAPAQAPASAAQENTAQYWYQKGYQDGFKAGYEAGLDAQRPIVVPSRE